MNGISILGGNLRILNVVKAERFLPRNDGWTSPKLILIYGFSIFRYEFRPINFHHGLSGQWLIRTPSENRDKNSLYVSFG